MRVNKNSLLIRLRAAIFMSSLISLASCSPGAVNVGKVRQWAGLSTQAGDLITSPADSRVALNWAALPGATTYDVLRSTSSSGPFVAINSNVQALTYLDTSVVNGVTYYYQVVSKVNSGREQSVTQVVAAQPINPPAGLIYAPATLNLVKGSALTPDSSTPNTGGAIASCSITPALPAGLSLDPQTCLISGTPTALASLTSHTVLATNVGGSATTTISIQVSDINPNIVYPSSPYSLVLGQAVTLTPSATGGAVTACTISPALPSGLSISGANCAISGTPSSLSALASYTVTASSFGNGSAPTSVTIGVIATPPSGLSFASSPFTLTKDAVMTAASSTHSGGAIVSCSGGSLPAGLSVSLVSGECQLSGTPTSISAASNYTITATNSGGSASATVNIRVNDLAPSALAFASAPFTLTKSAAMAAADSTHSGGTLTSCSSASLPAGLAVNLVSGECRITGTPTTLSSASNYTVTVSNTGGSSNATVSIAVVDVVPSALSFAASPFSLTKNSAMTAANSTHSGGTLTSCSSAGLPAGISVSLVSGECRISGTPTSVSASSNYTISATNSGGTGTASVSIAVIDVAPSVLAFAASPLTLTKNTAMTAANSTHTGGAITSCTGASLPAGISAGVASGECQLSGTPTTVTATASYTITAGNSGGSTTASVSITVNDVVPSTPIGLAATGGSQSVGLSWTQVTNASGYLVYRKSSSSVTTSDTLVCTVASGATTTCTDSSLPDGTTYFYAILSSNSGGSSSISASVSATTLPAAPTGVAVTASNTQNVISWSAVTSASSYTVKRGASGGPYSTTVTCSSSTATSCTETGLTNGTTYYYIVIANNGTGAGPASTQASGTPFGAANKLAFIASPGGQSYASQATFSPSLTVAIQDAGGNTVTSSSASVVIALVTNTPGGTLSGTLTQSAVNGIATFNNIKLDKAGTTYTMNATSSGLTAAPTTSAFTISAGAATQISIATAATAPATCAGPFTIQAKDAGGNNSTNNISGSAWSINLSVSSGSAVFYAGTDTGCTGSTVTTASIASGANSGTFYLKDPTAETFTITANGSGAGLGTATASLTVSAPAKYVFVDNQTAKTISMFKVNATTGVLSANSPASITTGASAPINLTVDPLNRFVYVSYGTTIELFTLNSATGLLTDAGVAVASGGYFYQRLIVDPTGKYLYSADNSGLQVIIMFSINQSTGALTALSTPTVSFPSGIAPGPMAMDPAGKYLYVTNTGGSGAQTLYMYTVGAGGILTTNGTLTTAVWPTGITVNSTGTFAYVTGYWNADIYMYSINASGVLVPLATPSIASGVSPYGVVVNSTGTYAYVIDRNANVINVYSINGATGQLTFSNSVATSKTTSFSIGIDSESKFIYSLSAGFLSSYLINQGTGLPAATAPAFLATGTGSNSLQASH